MNPKFKRIIGYEKIDNMITGIVLGFFVIFIAYYFQEAYYHIDVLGSFGDSIQVHILKLSLLAALFLFLVFNYLDKIFAMKGVLISVIITAFFIIYKLYFS